MGKTQYIKINVQKETSFEASDDLEAEIQGLKYLGSVQYIYGNLKE